MKKTRILGVGSYLPPRRLTNDDLIELGVDTSDEWIYRRTGIRERRMADPGTTTSDLAHQAAVNALEAASTRAEDLDMIIAATITPDTCCPSAANWLQARLDAPRAVSFDVSAACSGFIFGLNVAQQYLKSDACRTVLVVASEIMTRTVKWENRSSSVFWGDGAGAAVLGVGPGGRQLLSTHIHSDGAGGKNLLLPGGGSRTTPISHESVDKGLHYLTMIDANRSFKTAVKHFISAMKEAAEFNGVALEEIDWFIL
ncbi:MAG: beta-ketoacyl-ACP synthase 3 [Desulfobacterales bacterium]|nr:beta-ketoacyl-ACP synthase 3 [Desulfobacterales bacterium]